MLSDRLNRWNYCQCSTKFRDTLRRLSEAISHSFGQFFGADYPTSKVKNAIESHTMNIQLKRSIPIKILLRKPTSGRNVWLTVNTKRSISFTQTDLEQKNNWQVMSFTTVRKPKFQESRNLSFYQNIKNRSFALSLSLKLIEILRSILLWLTYFYYHIES